MFCPKCRSENVEGVAACGACGAVLVAALPNAPPPGFVEYEQILSTLNPAEIALIKSILEEEGIEYRFHGEIAGPPLALPARLLVPKGRADEAREVLAAFVEAAARKDGGDEDD